MHETRNRKRFEKIMHRTSKFEKSHYYCVAVFERLPKSIKCLATISFQIITINYEIINLKTKLLTAIDFTF